MKNSSYFRVFCCLLSSIGLISSCHKPFEGVNAIISNSYIKQRISIQVLDANPKAINPYPANSTITLSGDAVAKGLIYTGDGELISNSLGNVKLVNNSVTLAVKPYTQISESNPIKFTIEASSFGFLKNTEEVIVRSTDSLQYVQVKLLKPTALPTGVTNATSVDNKFENGSAKNDLVVIVKSTEPNANGVPTTQTQVQATFPAATVFKDNAGVPLINTNLVINVTNYSSSSPDAVTSINGGITNVTTSEGTAPQGFIVAGAVNITAELGGVSVKSFSNPIPVELFINPNTFNPTTKLIIKPGDSVPIWSKSEGSNVWVKESNVIIVKDPVNGRLKADIQVLHLSTWMVAFPQPMCNQPLTINYNSVEKEVKTIFIKINANEGLGQPIEEKIVSVKDGDKIEISLPSGLDVTVKVYEGTNASAPLINTLNVVACASSATLTNNRTTSNPSLYFDLQTACKDGLFRYSGPIDYRVTGTVLWEPFTPSVNGILTTKLLEWDKTYDFRIIYRGTEFKRTRQVSQAEFRLNSGNWSYFGKTAVKQTFFNAPTSCN